MVEVLVEEELEDADALLVLAMGIADDDADDDAEDEERRPAEKAALLIPLGP